MNEEDLARRTAEELHEAGRLEEAIALYTDLLRRSPNDDELLTARAAAFISVGKYERAIRDAVVAYEINDENTAAAFNAGLACDLSGDTNHAVDWFARACELEPDFGKAHSGLANAFYDLHEFEQAVDEYEAAASLEPEFDDLYLYWARALFRLGRYEEAERCFEIQFSLDAGAEAEAGIAQMRYLIGDFDTAREMLSNAVRRDPGDLDSLLYLASILRQDGVKASEIEERLAAVVRGTK